MQTAKVFTSGRSQAVRIPKEYQFEESEVFMLMKLRVVDLIQRHYSQGG